MSNFTSTYSVDVDGTKISLPIVKVSATNAVALVDCSSDDTLLEISTNKISQYIEDHVLRGLISRNNKKLKIVLLTAEHKGSLLMNSVCMKLKSKYSRTMDFEKVILRKEVKSYQDPNDFIEIKTTTVTSGNHSLFLNKRDISKIDEAIEVVIVDDVISSESTRSAYKKVVCEITTVPACKIYETYIASEGVPAERRDPIEKYYPNELYAIFDLPIFTATSDGYELVVNPNQYSNPETKETHIESEYKFLARLAIPYNFMDKVRQRGLTVSKITQLYPNADKGDYSVRYRKQLSIQDGTVAYIKTKKSTKLSFDINSPLIRTETESALSEGEYGAATHKCTSSKSYYINKYRFTYTPKSPGDKLGLRVDIDFYDTPYNYSGGNIILIEVETNDEYSDISRLDDLIDALGLVNLGEVTHDPTFRCMTYDSLSNLPDRSISEYLRMSDTIDQLSIISNQLSTAASRLNLSHLSDTIHRDDQVRVKCSDCGMESSVSKQLLDRRTPITCPACQSIKIKVIDE